MFNVRLSTYDVIRLRHAFKIPTQEFFKRNWVNFLLGKHSGLPLLMIDYVTVQEMSGIPKGDFFDKIQKEFFQGSESWQFKEGSATFKGIVDELTTKGFFAPTEDNKKNSTPSKLKPDSKAIVFLGNLMFNFDSFKAFSNDPRVVSTINEDVGHIDFMYVEKKVLKLIKSFTHAFSNDTGNSFDLDFPKFYKKFDQLGG